MIGASLIKPRYYAVLIMYVCVCVSAIRRPRVVLVRVVQLALIVTFNVDDQFHLEMININVTVLEMRLG